MRNINIEEDSKINPNDLDLEWREQAHLFGLYAIKHAEAIKHLAETRSELDNKFRNDWQVDYGKFSETALKNLIESDNKFIEADYKVNLLTGYVKTMEHKKQALENLVKLAVMNYFAVPREPKDLSRSSRFEERVGKEEVKERIRGNLKRTTT